MQKTVTNHQPELDRLHVRMKDIKTIKDLVTYSHKKFKRGFNGKSRHCFKSKQAIMRGLELVKL